MGPTNRYFENLATVFRNVAVTLGDGRAVELSDGIEEAVRTIVARAQAGRKVIFIGNGGSAAIASPQALDYWKNGGMRAGSFNDSSLLTCISNDFGDQHFFAKPIGMFAHPRDVLIAISSSSR